MDLLELHDRMLTLPSLENKLAVLRHETQKAEIEVESLLRQFEKERRDVERIKRDSLSSFLFRLVGKYEDKLEKEQREELSAKLSYDHAVTRRDNLWEEQEELTYRISTLYAERRTYEAALADRRARLMARLHAPEGIRYTALEQERQDIVSQITEIKEALAVVTQATETARRAVESLGSAENWANYDLFFGSGIIAHAAKYSHVDDAERELNLLSSQLQDLRAELNDVRELTLSGIETISSTERSVDFWFDNIFTDWSVFKKIESNAEETWRLIGTLSSVEAELTLKLRNQTAKLAENRRQEEALLVTLDVDHAVT